MHKIKKLHIALIISALFIMLIGVVFAAYSFSRQITDSNAYNVGQIQVNSKSFIKYNKYNPTDIASDINYDRKVKIRKDTVFIVDNIKFLSTDTYLQASTYSSTTTYYTRTGSGTNEDPYVYNVVLNPSEDVSSYYIKTTTYSGISSLEVYNNEATNLTYEIDSSTKKIITVKSGNTTIDTITCTIDDNNGVISTATSANEYNASIASDGLGIHVTNPALITVDNPYVTVSADASITCSATSNKYTAENATDAEKNNHIYLNQLGFEFTFTPEIPVYVRIHIQDAWKRTRVYSSSTRVNYVLKDQIEGESPFKVTDNDWYYDDATNYAYFKTLVEPTKTDDAYDSHSYIFNVNEGYFYIPNTTSTYKEYVDIEVSFSVDIVQANRAKALWGIDPKTIGNN